MLDISKLKNVNKKIGKTVAQCPACAAVGADSKGNHLVLYPDGKFGCVKNQDDKAHTLQILKLAGKKSDVVRPIVPIQRLHIPDSQVLLSFGRFGREKTMPSEEVRESSEAEKPSQRDSSIDLSVNERHGWGIENGVSMKEAEAFLDDTIG